MSEVVDRKRVSPFFWLLMLLFFWILFPSSLEGYSIEIRGAPSDEVLRLLNEVSELKNQIDRPPPTPYTLRRRAELDIPRFQEVLHAYGYYDEKIELFFSGEFPDMEITAVIDPGVCYRFGSITLLDADEEGSPLSCLPQDPFTPLKGTGVRSDLILDMEDQLLLSLACLGYPLAKMESREVVADQTAKEVFVTFSVNPGPKSFFGCVTFGGLKSVRSRFVQKRLLWKYGDLFNPKCVQASDQYLQESGLFSIVQITHPDELDEAGLLPMHIEVTETKQRHIGLGVSYSTDESVGAMGQWRHDNFTGWGDTLSLNGEVSKIIKRATLFYGLPDFMRRYQELVYLAEYKREDAPGYIEREVSTTLRIDRKVSINTSFSFGLRYERLLSTKSDNDENYNLFSLPLVYLHNTTNRLLDPSRGLQFNYKFTPYLAAFNNSLYFMKQELQTALIFPLIPSKRVIFAGAAQFGSILGDSRQEIPAPKRFYAGSSASLRGYAYLTVSPLDGTKPIGGRSLMIFQFEPRVRIYGRIYGAAFYELGNVFSGSLPPLNKKLLRSTGVGVRYLTAIGPLRFDIAFPLDRRRGIDKSFQLYASIGQTF